MEDVYTKEFEEIDEYSDRLRVPGGWIVRSWITGESIHSIFVSDPKGSWVFEDEE